MFGDLISLLTLQSLADAISAVLAIPLVPALLVSVIGIGLVPFAFRRLYRLISFDVAKGEAVRQAQFEIDLAQFVFKHPGKSIPQKVADELGMSVLELRAPGGLGRAIRNAAGDLECPECSAVIDENYVPDGSLGCSKCGWFEWDDDMPAGVTRKSGGYAPGRSLSGLGPEMDPVEAQEILDAERDSPMTSSREEEDREWEMAFYGEHGKAYSKSIRRHGDRIRKLVGAKELPF